MGPLLTAGLALAPPLINAIAGKKKGPDVGAINRRFMGQRPGGYLGKEDVAFGEAQRKRGTESVGAMAGRARQLAARRLAGRGIAGPALEQSVADVNQEQMLGTVGVNRNVGDILYSMFNRNQDFEREKLFKAWGLEAGGALQNEQLNRMGQSEFWNSQMEFLPKLLEMGGLGQPKKAA
jgi:hypothetical protein